MDAMTRLETLRRSLDDARRVRSLATGNAIVRCDLDVALAELALERFTSQLRDDVHAASIQDLADIIKKASEQLAVAYDLFDE
jgi:hypothetical protein